MQSENDRAFYRSLAPLTNHIQAVSPLPPRFTDADETATTAVYRRMIAGLDTLKAFPGWPTVGAYYPAAPIGGGLTSGLGVPNGRGPHPVIVHCHGNGYCAGDAESFKRTTYDFTHGGFVTVMPSYRLAPEARFPAAFDDMVAAVEWTRANIARYGGDPDRILIVGNSSGGSLAACVARHIMTTPTARVIRGLACLDGAYFTDNADGSYLAGRTALLTDPRVNVSAGLEAGMLPSNLFFSTGSADSQTVPALRLATLLRQLNTPFEFHLLEGMGHDCIRYPQLDGGRETLRLFLDFARRACGVASNGAFGTAGV